MADLQAAPLTGVDVGELVVGAWLLRTTFS